MCEFLVNAMGRGLMGTGSLASRMDSLSPLR